MSTRRLARKMLITIAAALLLTACGRGGEATATAVAATPTPINPQAALERTGDVMQGVSSFRFRLYHDNGSLELMPNFFVDTAQGDVVNPDKLSVSFEGKYGTGFAIRSNVITIGDSTYMTNPINGSWERSDTLVSPLGFFKPTEGISAMTRQVKDATLLADRTGQDGTFVLSGNLPAEALAPLLGQTAASATVRAELTVRAATGHLERAKISGAVTPSDKPDVVRTIVLSGFNESIPISAPTSS